MNPILRKFKTVFGVLRDSGLQGISRRLAERKYLRRQAEQYRTWLEKNGEPTDAGRESMRAAIDSFEHPPVISILLPVYNVDEKWLRRCIKSVLNQIYPNWQ